MEIMLVVKELAMKVSMTDWKTPLLKDVSWLPSKSMTAPRA
jgi:hypothetical protein